MLKLKIIILFVCIYFFASCNQEPNVKDFKYYLTNDSLKYWTQYKYDTFIKDYLIDDVCFYSNGKMIDIVFVDENMQRVKYNVANNDIYKKWNLNNDSIIINQKEYKIITLNDSIFEYYSLDKFQDTIKRKKSANQNSNLKIETLFEL